MLLNTDSPKGMLSNMVTRASNPKELMMRGPKTVVTEPPMLTKVEVSIQLKDQRLGHTHLMQTAIKIRSQTCGEIRASKIWFHLSSSGKHNGRLE
jgi:hypothetical protein